MNGKMKLHIVVLAAIMAFVMAAPAHAASAGVNSNPGVFPPNSEPYDHTYPEWNNMWWQWALSIPVLPDHPDSHPWFDQTGVNCGADQSGPVFYLVGVVNDSGTAVRDNCVVPAGKALFFPVLNIEWDTADGTPKSQLRPIVQSWMDGADETSLVAEVDGVPITNLERYRMSRLESPRPYFKVNLPDHNMYQYFGGDVPAGRYTAVADGYYLMLRPLSPGAHTIHFAGSFVSPAPYPFSVDITYRLTVR